MPSIQQLKQALAIAEKIKALEGQLDSILNSNKTAKSFADEESDQTSTKSKLTGGKKSRKAKRSLSPEALEKIREGQRKRWAKARNKNKFL